MTTTYHRMCIVALKGFHYAETKEESDALAAYFRQCFPSDKFPNMTVEQLFQDLPVKDGRVKCTVVFPAEAAKLTSDAPLVGDFNVWSKWSRLLLTLVAGITTGLCVSFGRRSDSTFLGDQDDPLAYLYPIGYFGLFGFCLAVLWSVSRDRLWRILKTFDALYIMTYSGILMSLLMYVSYIAIKDPVMKYLTMIGQALSAIPYFLCFICIDAVREHTNAKKVVGVLITDGFIVAAFAQFRFMRHTFAEKFEDALKQIIEVGVFRADLGVLIGTAAMNLGMFLIKYVFSLAKGLEYTILKFDAKSYVLDVAIHDAVGAAVDPPAVQGEADAEMVATKPPGHVLDVPHDDEQDDHPAEEVGDRKKAQQGNANEKGSQTDLLEVSYGYRGKRMTL